MKQAIVQHTHMYININGKCLEKSQSVLMHNNLLTDPECCTLRKIHSFSGRQVFTVILLFIFTVMTVQNFNFTIFVVKAYKHIKEH